MALERKNIGAEQAWRKIKYFCAYQERSHREVKEKLAGFGLFNNDADELLSRLVEENYLNEERFAIAFAGGKFRMKGWGISKIKFALQQKGVSPYCIKKALSVIDADDYEKIFNKLADAKWLTLKSEKNIFTKKKKLQNYLVGKGYEFNTIRTFLETV